MISLTVLLGGCASAVGNADAGPNRGGGFYDGDNINVGQINPSNAHPYQAPYTIVGQAYP